MTAELFEALVAEAAEVEVSENQSAIEFTLLTGAFTTPEARDLILKVNARDFHFDTYRKIAALTWPIMRDGGHVDRVTFGARLADQTDAALAKLFRGWQPDERADLLSTADRVFAQVHDQPPSLEAVAAYLKIFVSRAATNLAKNLIAKIGEELDRGDLSPDQAAAKIAQIWSDLETGRRLVGSLESEAFHWPTYFSDLEDGQDPRHEYQGLNSGFDYLNNVANGLTEGLFVLGAAPSTGKTTFAKQLADQVAELNTGADDTKKAAVLFVSLEQSAGELRVKTLSRMSGIENRDILRGRLDPRGRGWQSVKAASVDHEAQVAGRLFILEGDKNTTPDRVRLQAMQIKRATGADVVFIVIDYLQIMPVEGEYKDPRSRVDAVVSDLRRLARDLRCPVMAISAVGRVSYDRPSMASFKESGGVEYGADLGAVMARDKDKVNGIDQVNGAARSWKQITVDIVKNRNGERARLVFKFYPEVSLFVEVQKSSLPDEDPSQE